MNDDATPTPRWEWAENSILRSNLVYAAPREVFRAVCAELGRYYEHYGFVYSASRPKLVKALDDLRFEIAFWSSHSNLR